MEAVNSGRWAMSAGLAKTLYPNWVRDRHIQHVCEGHKLFRGRSADVYDFQTNGCNVSWGIPRDCGGTRDNRTTGHGTI